MLKMLNNKILVKPIEAPKETTGGLLLTDAQGLKSYKGEVLCHSADLTVKTGDTVVYSEFAGSKINLKGTQYLILDAQDVWAVEEK